MGELYIGLISGTSMDGVDAALVEFSNHGVELRATRAHPYPDGLRRRLAAAVSAPAQCTVDEVGRLDHAVGVTFRDAALRLLEAARTDAGTISAIGSHGQTLRHSPHSAEPFSLQIGDPAAIATGTRITTIADFRRADIAVGGEGAPLAPAFHDWLFRESGRPLGVLNIGGIANLTLLPGDDGATTGFDSGPGNTLMDAWIRRHQGLDFDRDGRWSGSGRVDEQLLKQLIADPYFSAAGPKSTGFEYFNLDWLDQYLPRGADLADVQATLCELSAASIAAALQREGGAAELLVCGGGVHNAVLMERLAALLPDTRVASTATRGLDPDWVEAAAFAWLAMRRLAGLPGNLPAVTGAGRAVPLGAVHAPG